MHYVLYCNHLGTCFVNWRKGFFFNPLTVDKILDWVKSKQIADDILKVHLN